ncbi:MAG: hydratase [Oscillospiraceae bacterium]|nr:hydratase [Oscillospiraceae bacterium]
MIELRESGVYLVDGKVIPAGASADLPAPADARENTMAYSIMRSHDKSRDPKKMRLKFDALMSHDITYVGIIQTARASGLQRFPIPYAMTNCHNSLCAVGGTINEDDHVFGLSAAKKYGGIYVPVNQSVIHQYAREEMAGCGNMILGSDSHTRYGAIGCMGVGEGGPELVKQLLENTYDIDAPEVVLVYLTGAPRHGVGPHDVAIALCGAVFGQGFVTNRVLEFAGPGIGNLSVDFRLGIDVMTTETACLSSIWETDEKVEQFYRVHGKPERYKALHPGKTAYYDRMIAIDLSEIEPMIALPFHPSMAYTIRELQSDPYTILKKIEEEGNKKFGGQVEMHLTDKIHDGKVLVDQGVIAGCAGGLFENLCEAAAILNGGSTGNGDFALNVYPASVPVSMAVTRNGVAATLLEAGCIMKTAFCGPCFGAGDVPSHNGLSIRHTTRNFPNREGSKPGQGQIASVALMDARSIAATARNGGVLTSAAEIDYEAPRMEYVYDGEIYKKRCYYGFGKADPDAQLKLGPNITDWPRMHPLQDNLLVRLCAVIRDPVTTTDELIPSGETSSYRSNPLKLSEFALSRRVPEYVGLSKACKALEDARWDGEAPTELLEALGKVVSDPAETLKHTTFGSGVFACRPGDGSAREQAASCQKVLGGCANIAYSYATKRYRSNCINWGILPFTIDESEPFGYESGDTLFVPGIREAIRTGQETISGKMIGKDGVRDITLYVKGLTEDEKTIILEGCLMNYYAAGYGRD